MIAEILNIVRNQSAPIASAPSLAHTEDWSAQSRLSRMVMKRARDAGNVARNRGHNVIVDESLGIRIRYYSNMTHFAARSRSLVESTRDYFGSDKEAIAVVGIEAWVDMVQPCSIADRLGVGFAVYHDKHFTGTPIAKSLAPWLIDVVFLTDEEEAMVQSYEAETSDDDPGRLDSEQ